MEENKDHQRSQSSDLEDKLPHQGYQGSDDEEGEEQQQQQQFTSGEVLNDDLVNSIRFQTKNLGMSEIEERKQDENECENKQDELHNQINQYQQQELKNEYQFENGDQQQIQYQQNIHSDDIEERQSQNQNKDEYKDEQIEKEEEKVEEDQDDKNHTLNEKASVEHKQNQQQDLDESQNEINKENQINQNNNTSSISQRNNEISQSNHKNQIKQQQLSQQDKNSYEINISDKQSNIPSAKQEQKKRKVVTVKKLLSPEELNIFLKKHKLISSSSISDDNSQQEVKAKPKQSQKQATLQKSKPTNEVSKLIRPQLQQQIEQNKQIYRICQDPFYKKFSPIEKQYKQRKFFSILDLDLSKQGIQHICSFLQNKDILKLRLVHKSFQIYLREYFEKEKKKMIEKQILQIKIEQFEILDRIKKEISFRDRISTLTGKISQNVSHLHMFLYFDKLDVNTLSVNEVKLIKIFYEVLKTKPSIINSIQVLTYCSTRKDDNTLFGDLNITYDFMNVSLQLKFYQELQVIVDFLKINNNAIVPFILDSQIFILPREVISRMEKNLFIEKTYSSNLLKGIYNWLELQLFYNQHYSKYIIFQELNQKQEQINYIKHSYDILTYLLNKVPFMSQQKKHQQQQKQRR